MSPEACYCCNPVPFVPIMQLVDIIEKGEAAESGHHYSPDWGASSGCIRIRRCWKAVGSCSRVDFLWLQQSHLALALASHRLANLASWHACNGVFLASRGYILSGEDG